MRAPVDGRTGRRAGGQAGRRARECLLVVNQHFEALESGLEPTRVGTMDEAPKQPVQDRLFLLRDSGVDVDTLLPLRPASVVETKVKQEQKPSAIPIDRTAAAKMSNAPQSLTSLVPKHAAHPLDGDDR